MAIDVYDNKIRIEPGAAAHVETTLESLCVDLKSFGQRSGNPSKGDAEMRAVLRVYPSTDHVVAAAIAGALKACGVQFSVKVQESEW